MPKIVDETDNRYGRLVVVGLSGIDRWGKKTWKVNCDCGKSSVIRGDSLRSGNTKSCGCASPRLTHGLSGHAAYDACWNAKDRCSNKAHKQYANYGGRGIQFKFTSFEQFWEELGPTWEEGLTLDRKDNNGHYEPGNCRWATYSEQNSNRRNRRSSLHVTVNGQLLTLKQLSQVTGKSRYLIVKMYHKHGPNFRDWPIT